jgi:ABC-type polysaccharide/polyol phosphate transport system ATPase subunit
MEAGSNTAIVLEQVEFGFLVQQRGVNTLKEFLHGLGKGKAFVKKKVLDGVSFSVEKGECFAVLGRNGSGKSTLLRVASGIIRPDKGNVRVNGKIAPILALGVGLEPELSGYENIRLCGLLLGVPKKEQEKLVKEVKEFSELEHEDLKLQVKRYSTGMMARLAFSTAIVPEPDILVVDEVLAVGDAGFQEKCYHRIGEIRRQGSTIIFVSHSIPDVQRICTRGIVLDHGKVVQQGDVQTITEFYHQLCTA